MERTKYAVEFKSEAVKQVIDKGHAVVDVASGLVFPRGGSVRLGHLSWCPTLQKGLSPFLNLTNRNEIYLINKTFS